MPTVTDYFSGLSAEQKSIITHIIKRCREKGIVNDFIITAILCIVSKECNFKSQYEKDYSQTSVERIREVFPVTTRGLSDAKINELKLDPVKWFNFLYGGKNGNRPGTNDGYFYRGRFFNQITFRALYEKLSKQLNLPELLTNPDKFIDDIGVATDILIQYYKNVFDQAKVVKLYLYDKRKGEKVRPTTTFAAEYGAKDINGFTNLELAVRGAYHCNAGLGRSVEYIKSDHFKGLKKAMGRSQKFLQIVQQTK